MNVNRLSLALLLSWSCICSFNSLSQTDWAVSLTGGLENSIGFSVVTDQSDNVYSTGQYTGLVDFDPGVGVFNKTSQGSTDIYIQKLDPNGNLIWAHSLGSFGSDNGISMAIDASDNLYITGAFQGTIDFDLGSNVENMSSNGGFDIFILKLDSNGDFIWAKSVGGTGWDVPTGTALDAIGNLYTVGYFSAQSNDVVDFNPNAGVENFTCSGSSDMFIQKLDVDGNFIWAKKIGGSGFDRAYGVAVDNNNNPLFTGYFESFVDFDPNAGFMNLTSNGFRDIHITKFDINGDLIWAKSIGASDFDGGYSIDCDDQNDVYVTGFFTGSVDFNPNSGSNNHNSLGGYDIFVLKLSENGGFDWANSYGGSNDDFGRHIAIDNSNNLYLTGHFSLSADFGLASGNLISNGGKDIFIQKIDASGNPLLAHSFGGMGTDHGISLTVTNSGKIYTTGFFQATVDFDASVGTLNLTTSNYQEVFILKLSLLDHLGITNIQSESEFSISPNPNSGKFFLQIDQKTISALISIEIFNEFGQSIWTCVEIEPSNSINFKDKVPGVYFIKIVSEHGITVKKFVVN